MESVLFPQFYNIRFPRFYVRIYTNNLNDTVLISELTLSEVVCLMYVHSKRVSTLIKTVLPTLPILNFVLFIYLFFGQCCTIHFKTHFATASVIIVDQEYNIEN